MSHTNDSLVMSHGTNSFYISIFIYQQKKRSRSWRAGCHNGCTGYDSGVVRYWIVCWIGWHFVITLKQIWNKNDVIMLRNDVIMLKMTSLCSYMTSSWLNMTSSYFFNPVRIRSLVFFFFLLLSPLNGVSWRLSFDNFQKWSLIFTKKRNRIGWKYFLTGCHDHWLTRVDFFIFAHLKFAILQTSSHKKSYRKSNNSHILHH